ncbi:MAG: uroporphyrinogen-III C-methyltransferase [Oscillospiraceae bacterium]
MSNSGKVYLIGAGCGRYDLITLRGKQLLSECDVVVYDSLADSRLLDFAPENAEKIPVGKRCGKPSEKQENINGILVEKALEGKTVARLKGGDPFVFGRGGEEIMALAQSGIEYEVVPGITSCVAVPELAGIPVTHRRVSRGFHVVTGHTADDLLPENMSALAKENDTLVFLMGLNRLREIADTLIANGKPEDTPAAVISDGCTSAQRVVRAALCDIAEACENAVMTSPAVIVIGAVAGFDFSKTVTRPLDNTTVTAVGTDGFTQRLDERLSRLGADVLRIPLIRITENAERLDNAVSELAEYDTVVFTSANGVKAFFGALCRTKTDIRALAEKRFAVIGAATAQALEQYGIYADILPQEYNAQSLAYALAQRADVGKALILRAEKGSQKLNEILDSRGVNYRDVKIYDTIPIRADGYRIDSDFLVFGSSSGVTGFYENGFAASERTAIVAIGEQTANALKEHGASNYSIARQSDINGIAQKIAEIRGAVL